VDLSGEGPAHTPSLDDFEVEPLTEVELELAASEEAKAENSGKDQQSKLQTA
jgi:hypothetical protein